jgi:hypothetical protein
MGLQRLQRKYHNVYRTMYAHLIVEYGEFGRAVDEDSTVNIIKQTNLVCSLISTLLNDLG